MKKITSIKTRSNSKEKLMNRMFMVTKIFLTSTPVIAYFYVTLLASTQQLSFQEVLVAQPSVTIIFLIAMINPYIAYLIDLIQKKLECGDHRFALINMALLLVAQMLTMNLFYFMMLLYVFYKAIHYYNVNLKEFRTFMTIKQAIWNGGGSMFAILISSICLFASIQLM